MKDDYDCIIATLPTSIPSLLAFAATKLRRKPLIFWSETWSPCGYPVKNRSGILLCLKNLFYKFIVRGANAIVVPGTSSKEFHQKLGISPDKIFIANQSAMELPANSNGNIKITDKEASEKILLFSGRLMNWKGPDVLLRSFAEIEKKANNIRLVIIGSGPLEEECKQLINDLQLKKVDLVGSVKYEDLFNYWSIADLFVLPNTGRPHPEAWGIVFNEALSMGLPVICTKYAGAVKDLVHDGENGLIVEAGNPEELAEAIIKVLQDEETIKAMGECSRKIYNQFNSYEKMAGGFKDAINYVMRRKK
jgi:glycosyltransferase involved in cell wall biosynthesis